MAQLHIVCQNGMFNNSMPEWLAMLVTSCVSEYGSSSSVPEWLEHSKNGSLSSVPEWPDVLVPYSDTQLITSIASHSGMLLLNIPFWHAMCN